MVRIGSIVGWIEALGQDLRYAARGMCKSPAFTLVVVLTLAIGIGGPTTIVSAIDALLLRPLPYPNQDRLVALSNSYPKSPEFSKRYEWNEVVKLAVSYRVEFVESSSLLNL